MGAKHTQFSEGHQHSHHMTHGTVCGSISATRKIVGVDACDPLIIDLVMRRLSNVFVRRKFDVWASSRKSWRTAKLLRHCCSRPSKATLLAKVEPYSKVCVLDNEPRCCHQKSNRRDVHHERVVGGEIRRTRRAGRVGLLRRVSLIPHR